ncbi:unannotated protein [freshwater metagenome]|uniref:Unannotated protein n=1 Tax=freshwater metagenome TaxID=449393 RepID=A0A6J6F2D0_9ZZZZ
MTHKNHGHVTIALKIVEQIKYLRLDGDVERCGWLIGEENLGSASERDRDGDALTHSA